MNIIVVVEHNRLLIDPIIVERIAHLITRSINCMTTIIEERIAYFQKIIPKLDSERTKERMREYIVNRINCLIKNIIPKYSYFIITQD
jgi:hypothetical protein